VFIQSNLEVGKAIEPDLGSYHGNGNGKGDMKELVMSSQKG